MVKRTSFLLTAEIEDETLKNITHRSVTEDSLDVKNRFTLIQWFIYRKLSTNLPITISVSNVN